MTTERKPLSGIVTAAGGNNDDIFDRFDSITAADDFAPLPKGTYVCLATKGERTTAKTGTRGYTVEFKVIEGEHTNRRVWKTWYFTEAAAPYTKRDLAKIGLDSKQKLSAPFPADRMVFKVMVTLRCDDDGAERNELKSFELLRVQEPEVDPYAPPDEGGAK